MEGLEAVGSGPLTCDITGLQRPILFNSLDFDILFVAKCLGPVDDLGYN